MCPAKNSGLAVAHKHPKLGWFYFDKTNGKEYGPFPHEKAALEAATPSPLGNVPTVEKKGPVLVEKPGKLYWAKCTDSSRVQRLAPGRLGLDPVHEHGDGKWFFYDKSWMMECGPYPTKQEAQTWCSRFSAGEIGG